VYIILLVAFGVILASETDLGADERRARPLDLKNGPAENPGIYCAFGAGTIFCVWWLLRRGGTYMYRLP